MWEGGGRVLLNQWKIGVQVSQCIFEEESSGKSRQSQEREQGVEVQSCAAKCNALS